MAVLPHAFTGDELVLYNYTYPFCRLVIDDESHFTVSNNGREYEIGFDEIEKLNVEGSKDYSILIDGTVTVINDKEERHPMNLTEIKEMKENASQEWYYFVSRFGIVKGKLTFYFSI